MPHATSVPFTGFQAVILCGPGVSLNTFTANPEDFPKALVPIANRPMVWYPLDWCYRIGIHKIHLITPQTSLKALEAALSQNPHLTSLPSPKADIIAPAELTHTTPTAEILRLPEVQAVITGDFLILPCDLVCELPGESLLEAWLIHQSGLGGLSSRSNGDFTSPSKGGQSRRGGLGVYFETRGSDCVKGAETDFIITTSTSIPSTAPPPMGSLQPYVSKLLYATTTDTLRDITDEEGGLPIRHGLIRKHGKVRILTTHRDAHIYLFPHWVMHWVRENEGFDSISEDVVGWWAKCGWQDGLGEKLQIGERASSKPQGSVEDDDGVVSDTDDDGSINLASLSSTYASKLAITESSSITTATSSVSSAASAQVPPMLAYIHPSAGAPASTIPASTSTSTSSNNNTTATSSNNIPNNSPPPHPLIRRVDTPHLLLQTSLYIASLPIPSDLPIPTTRHPPSPLSHATKIHPEFSPGLIAPHTTIQAATTLMAPNTTVQTHATVKASVIGANCTIHQGARITGSLLMDGVVVGEKANLHGCIVGRRAVIGTRATLKECEVQEGYVVPDGTDAKGEKMSVFEGLEEDAAAAAAAAEGEDDDDDGDENGGDGDEDVE